MLVDIEPLDGYRLKLRFEDGVEDIIDVAECVSCDGAFAPLKDPKEFALVYVNEALGTICWPCGANLDADVLYWLIRARLSRNEVCRQRASDSAWALQKMRAT
jgi:hypothetical protein